MRFKDLLDLYDNWNGTIIVNDDDLRFIVKTMTSNIGFNCTPIDYSNLYDKEVVSFGFFDNAFRVRLKV
jgi:hypothetical protein